MSQPPFAAIEQAFNRLSEIDDARLREQALSQLREEHPALADAVEPMLRDGSDADRFFDDLEASVGQNIEAMLGRKMLEGRAIGPYQILERVAAGGMGVVYRAERSDGAFEREVALKLIQLGIDDDDTRLRFAREGRILGELDHPNIARLLDAGLTEEARPYLVMEFVRGKSITDHCDGERLSLRQRLKSFCTVAEAAGYAHRHLVVHRDLKPANVMVDDRGIVKLLDFGVAKLLSRDGETTTELAGGLTPAYAAPEQLLGGVITTATDVFSLGLLLLELVTGFEPTPTSRRKAEITGSLSPGKALQSLEDLSRVAARRRMTVAGLRRQIRGDLGNILTKSLNADPARRYANGAELAADVDRLLKQLPISAKPDNWSYRLQRFIVRHPIAIGFASAALATLIGLVIVLSQQTRDLRHERDKSRAVVDLMLEAFSTADPDYQRGRDLDLRDVLDRGTARIVEQVDDPDVTLELLPVLVRAHRNLGLYEEARELAQRWLQLATGDDRHLARLTAAEISILIGDSAQAEVALRSLLDDLADDSPLAARVMARLGRALVRQNKRQEARPLLVEAVAHFESRARPASGEHASALNDLSALDFRSGDFASAESSLLQALAIRGAFEGESPGSEYATLLNNLGLARYLQGRLVEALPPLERGLNLRRELLPPEHPDIAQSTTNLGLLAQDEGRLDDAEAYLSEALNIRQESLGESHPLYAQALNNLAMLAQNRDQVTEAISLFEEALLRLTEHYGAEHPVTATAHSNLGSALADAERWKDARRHFERSLEIRREALPENHPHFAYSFAGMGRVEIAQGNLSEARRVLEQAISLRSQAGGWLLAEVEYLLADCLSQMGEAEAADGLFESAIEVLNQERGPDDRQTRRAVRLHGDHLKRSAGSE